MILTVVRVAFIRGAVMRKIILMMLLLAVVSNKATAEAWLVLGVVAANGGFTFYADITSIRKNGNTVKMWSLEDFKTAQISTASKPFLSVKLQDEYDCKYKQKRILAFTGFSGNMGNGEVVHSYPESESDKWLLIRPESVGEVLWKFACGLK
jgi:hypothetical protein